MAVLKTSRPIRLRPFRRLRRLCRRRQLVVLFVFVVFLVFVVFIVLVVFVVFVVVFIAFVVIVPVIVLVFLVLYVVVLVVLVFRLHYLLYSCKAFFATPHNGTITLYDGCILAWSRCQIYLRDGGGLGKGRTCTGQCKSADYHGGNGREKESANTVFENEGQSATFGRRTLLLCVN